MTQSWRATADLVRDRVAAVRGVFERMGTSESHSHGSNGAWRAGAGIAVFAAENSGRATLVGVNTVR
jgi:hypothetical protein